MRFPRLTLPAHLVLLAIFAIAMILVWMLPVLLAGYPSDIPTLLLPARNFAEAGVFSITDHIGRYLTPALLKVSGEITAGDGRLSMMLNGWISTFVPFSNLVGWSFVASVIMALSLFPWWIAVRSFFSTRIAWIATVIFALMPIYWREAVFPNNYQFALLFLFCSFAAYGLLRKKSPLLAVAMAGIFFGLAVSAKDAFLVFVPWFVICAFIFYRPAWKKLLLTVVTFGVCALIPYLAPYIGDIRTVGYPVNQNLARVWPGGDKIANEIYLHLYPDPYTYFQDRERFDRELLARIDTMTTLERLQYQKILLNFDVGQPSFGDALVNGVWLFAGSIPSYFQQDVMGGMALWLFILPGVIVLWKRHRRFAVALLGLLILTELEIRFVLHFNREHLMDTGWVLALLAGIGVAAVSDVLAASAKKYSVVLVSCVITILVSGQLLQANRVRFARVFASTVVADTVAAAEEIKTVPIDAVVAVPPTSAHVEQLALLSNRSVVLFAPETIERLLEQGTVRDVFQMYGITHVMRYSEALTKKLQRAIPGLKILEDPNVGAQKPNVSTELRWLLHMFR